VKALANMALTHGMHPQLLNAVMEINDFQRKHVILKVRDLLGGSLEGKQIGLLGLAFKPNTDDVRDAPSLTIARSIVNQGGKVRAYDPVAMETATAEFSAMGLCETAYEVADGADAVIVITEWNEFKQLDMTRVRDLMKTPNLIDARNLYDPADMQAIGFVYRGMGRGYNGEGVE
jgi:UDPglucose 6-dehydrogenase